MQEEQKIEETSKNKNKETDEIIEKRKERLKEKFSSWAKDPYTLALIAILVFSIIIRLYYFFLTSQQPLWWDEAEYMSTAKHWALGTPFEFAALRMPLLIFLGAIFFKIGFTEVALKFLITLFSIGLVVVSYFLVKEMYDKKIALIVAFMSSIFWLALFNTFRIHNDVPLMFLMYLALFFFWKGYIKGRNIKMMIYFGISAALALLMKPTAGLLFISLVIFVVITERFAFIKRKELWLGILTFFVIMSPYFIYSYSTYGTPLAFLGGSHVFSDPAGAASLPFAWQVLGFPQWLLEWPFFIFFIIGLIVVFGALFLKIDMIFKNKNKQDFANLFIIIWFLITLVYFIFIERGNPEDRWIMPVILAIFIFSSKGVLFLYEFVKKYQKVIAIGLIIVILAFGFYLQFKHADSIIKVKKDTYMPVKEASLWIKENSNPDDVILSRSITQVTFYSERKVYGFGSGMNESRFDALVAETKPRYLLESIFEPNPAAWGYALPEKYNNIWKPVKVWFADETQQQAVLIVYERTRQLT